MFPYAAMLAAGAIATPTILSGSLEPKFTSLINLGGSAATKVRVVISEAGVPIGCDVVFTNGPASNGEAFCAMILRSVRYTPAHAGDGKAMAGVVYAWSQWKGGHWLGSDAPVWDPVDLGFQVDRLPKGIPDMATLQLRLVVSGTGRIDECQVMYARATPRLTQLLCDRAGATPPVAVKAGDGQTIASVQPYRVRIVSKGYMERLQGDGQKRIWPANR